MLLAVLCAGFAIIAEARLFQHTLFSWHHFSYAVCLNRRRFGLHGGVLVNADSTTDCCP